MASSLNLTDFAFVLQQNTPFAIARRTKRKHHHIMMISATLHAIAIEGE